MKILAIESATSASSVAIGRGGNVAAMALQVDRKGHVGFLVPAIDFCFERAGWAPTDLDAVAVDVGPGPYSGIRAGIAAAQAIAASVGVPVITLTSLTMLAWRAATGRRRIWPVVDVRRGQVATRPYLPVPGGVVPDGPAEIVTPDEFRGMLSADGQETLIVGEWQVLPEGLLRAMHTVKKGRPRYPAADVMLEVAAMRAEAGEFAGPEDIRPLYMREPDAQINWNEFRHEGLWETS
jgi:tRNA threonylcarbamoyl adenosine modification protein YeaZ